MAMTVTASANAQLDDLLDRIVAALQLTATQHQSAEDKYGAVGRWLSADASPVRALRPTIYPQGSLRLGTTVKPRQHEEFDLDLVCELLQGGALGPEHAYELVWSRMADNERYRPILERLPRCLRLNYANDFHLDIVPAIPDSSVATGGAIFIPDRSKKAWQPSHPKGYCAWFEARASLARRKDAMEASIEPLRRPETLAEKPPLKLAVQLYKRWRDVAFASRPSLAPASIVLTTLAGIVYRGDEHVTDALTGILEGTVAWCSREPIQIWNPANNKECLTDRWHATPGAYHAFVEEVGAFARRWDSLVRNGTYPQLLRDLESIFGQGPVQKAAREYAQALTRAREVGTLHASRATGTLMTASAANSVRVPNHTFFGSDDA